MSRWMIGLFALCFMGFAQANIGKATTLCVRNGGDLCSMAKAMELSLREGLPYQINDMITMESAKASMAHVIIVMRIDKEKGEEFRTALSEMPDLGESIKAMMVERTLDNGCDDADNFDFILAGGRITYQFLYADNELFSAVQVTHCTDR